MMPICLFETDAEEAMRIWNAGVALYDRIGDAPSFVHPSALPAYCDATLLLTADSRHVAELIENEIQNAEDAKDGCVESILTLPLAIESYYAYTSDRVRLADFVMRLEKQVCDEKYQSLFERYKALSLGFETVMMRLRAECGMQMQRAELGRKIAEYHKKHYDGTCCIYKDADGHESLIETVIVAAFGFLSDDAHETVRMYVIDHAFELPREWYFFLYMALSNLEVQDSFYACIVEGGLPSQICGAEGLSGIIAMLKYMVGVDIAMLGKGIECSTPCMPSQISYRVSLPVGKTYLTYEREGTL